MSGPSFRPSAWAINHPLIPLMALIVAVLVGIMSYIKLPITQFPDVSIPIVSVSAVQVGTQPEDMERQITSKIESAVSNVAGVKRVTSTISEGMSSTVIEFQLGVDLTKAVQDVKDKVTGVRSELPAGLDEPVVSRFDVEGGAVLTFAVESDKQDMAALTWTVDDKLKKAMTSLKGVAKVTRQGGIDPEIQWILDHDKVVSRGLSLSQIQAALRGQFVNGSAGFVYNDNTLMNVSFKGEKTLQELNATTIAVNGTVYALRELGTVAKVPEKLRSIARVNGKPALVLEVFRSKGSSEVSVKQALLAKLPVWEKQYGIKISTIQDQVKPIESSYHSTVSSFLEGTALAVLVVWLFLRNWRATLISALAIPFSAIPTFFILEWMGFTLNMVSMLALSLVSGILVDDAIVEIENIVRHRKMGKTPLQAAIDAADEIGLAVVATSAVIVAVFVPVSFMDGVVGQYFREFGITVAVSVICSLLVARFITPVMAAYFMTTDVPVHEPAWVRYYDILLAWVLKHRVKTLLAGLGFILLSGFAAQQVPTGFVTESDNGVGVFSVKFSAGTTLPQADRALQQLATNIAKLPEVRTVMTSAGDVSGNAFSVASGTVRVVYVHKSERQRTTSELESIVIQDGKAIPGLEVSGLRADGQKAFGINIVSNDTKKLYEYGEKLEQYLNTLPELQGVTSSLPKLKTEWQLHPRYDQMAKFGVTASQIMQELRMATQGETKANALKFKAEGRELALFVGFNKDLTISDVRTLPISTSKGVVPLGDLATVELGTSPASLEKLNQTIQVSFSANLKEGVALGTALNKVRSSDIWQKKPTGIDEVQTGDAELIMDLFLSFGKAMALGILYVYLTLVLLFRSPWKPFVVLWSLPLSVGGAVMGLMVAGQSLNMSALIGVLMLMGIVGKNAILLVDYAMEKEESEGLPVSQAIAEAGHQRVQPIIMTTIAMIAGMVPVVLGLGDGSEFRIPMGAAVIGGLLTSTLLSLLFVPALYSLSHDGVDWFKSKFRTRQP